MAHIFLSSSDRGIVEFKIWKSLIYNTRLLISIGLILVGFLIQYFSYNILPGAVIIFLGNILLLPSGYNNRVNLGKFDPQSDWEKAGKHKLDELLTLDRKIRKWDKSTIDASNALGGFLFLILLGIIGYLGWDAFFESDNKTMQIITVDAAVLLIPYWVTGLRSIFTVPTLTKKIKLINTLLSQVEPQLQAHKVEYFLLLKGKDTQVPTDVKFKVNIANQHKDFLGYYGQVTLNNVQSTAYPYFYVVMVARKDFGLKEIYNSYRHSGKIVKEFKKQKDVEVLVIRKNTKVGSRGYQTGKKEVQYIFLEGLKLAEKAAIKGGGESVSQ
ncbi:MAG: hypothetical protein PVH61_38070 [Candidatus Aminicenantes bacterium]|jgi:hypothetical protein